MSEVLFIETSTPRGSVGMTSGTVWCDETFESERSHNCAIFAPLEKFLTEKISCVVVGTGPGSYSGTRVGIAAAQGIAIVHGCPAVGVASILAVPLAVAGKKCIAIGDARRGDWWYAIIEHGKIQQEPTLIKHDLLEKYIDAEDADFFTLEDSSTWKFSKPIHKQVPSAAGLHHAWSVLSDAEKNTLIHTLPQPVYIKPPHITVSPNKKIPHA